MSSRNLKAVLVFSTALATLGLHQQALAADAAADSAAATADDGGDAIVITARRREEKLQEVPITVSAVSGRTLATERLDRVADYTAKIANFGAIQQNTRVSTLTIRGVGGNANSDGSEAGVGLIVDNVFFTHPGFSWLDFVDLDHIELARGPQGTLLGKNTTLGALIVTTQKPSFTPSATVGLTAANHDHFQVRANVTGPLIGDKLAGRLTFYRDVSDGSITNAYDGKKYLDNNRLAVRGQLLFEDGNFTDRLIAEHYQTREYNNFYPPVGDPVTYTNGTARNGWAARLKTAFGYTPNYDVYHNANLNRQQRVVSRTEGLSNQADWKLGDFTLTSVTAWRKLYFRPSNDSDYSPYSIFDAGYDVDVNQYSQEVRLASPTDRAVEYQVGAFFLRQDVISNYRTRLFSDASAFLLSPALPSAILNGVEADQLGRSKTNSGAVFGQATWHASDKASITAGLRYTRERKKASNDVFSFGGVALTGPLAPYAAYRSAVVGAPYSVSDEKTKGSVSWLINPAYKFDDNLLGYISISHGEKSGAANLGAKVGDPVIIDPEKSTDYEVGLKSTLLGGRATLNADLYWTEINGYQATLIDTSGTTARSYLANVGKVRLRGIEVEGQVQATDDLNLSANLAYGESIYQSYTNAPPPSEATYVGAPATIDLSGTQVPFAPRFTGQVSFSYKHPVGDNLALFAYGNQTWRSSTYLNARSPYGRQSGYGLTNVGIGLRTTDDRYAIQLWAKNLFDKRYAAAFASATAYTPYIEILGDPRTFGVTLTLKAF